MVEMLVGKPRPPRRSWVGASQWTRTTGYWPSVTVNRMALPASPALD